MDIEHIYLRDADAGLITAWQSVFEDTERVSAEQGIF